MMRRFIPILALIAVALLVAACEKPITQLILVVDTDLDVPRTIDLVRINVEGPSGIPSEDLVALAGDGAVALPLSLSLVAGSDRLGPVRITVDGQATAGAGMPPSTVVSRRIQTTFVADETRVVLVRLLASCVSRSCTAEETCNDGACRPVFVPASELEPWTGRVSVPERCNDVDDDADGAIDEDFDLDIDTQNCGMCGNPCPAGLACGRGSCMSDPVTSIAAAGQLTCALRMSGAVLCWGIASGLGDGAGLSDSGRPVAVVGVTDAMSIGVGSYYGCAVRRGSGRVSCWGTNGGGELGNGTTESPIIVARDAVGVTGATRVAPGYFHTCTLLTDRSMKCWGHGNAGELGIGSLISMTLTPLDVMSLTDATQIDVGFQHTCAARADASISCWGDGGDGRLGTGDTVSQPRPAASMFTDAAEVAAGENFTCVRANDRRVRCVGAGAAGQLGSDQPSGSLTPIEVPSLMAVSIATEARAEHVCAILSDETVSCWGNNLDGQLGDGTLVSRPQPMPVMGLSMVQQLALGTTHSCALTRAGRVFCWGANSAGQLGIGGTTSSTTPVMVMAL